jgi:soluble lytic murein transglycosylase-like protein
MGSDTQLWLCSGDGSVTIPTDQIARFEHVEKAVPQAPALPPVSTAEAPSKPQSKDSIQTLIVGAAARYRIDPDFVTSVVKAESGFNAAAVSPKGAQGLMQLMPRTAATLGVGNPFDPASNVEAGTRYLRQLLDQYSGDAAKALAAYNAGSGRVEQYGGIPPYRETRSYVSRIIADYIRKKLQQQAPPAVAPTGK